MNIKKGLLIPLIVLFSLSGCNSNNSENNDNKEQNEVCIHYFVDHQAKAATCTEDGNIAYAECTKCHKLFSSNHLTEIKSYIIYKTGHNLTHHEESCTNIEYWDCSNCHLTFLDASATEVAEEVTADNHDFIDYPAHPATCLEAGNVAYAYCKKCKKLYAADHQTLISTYIIPKLQHDMTHHEAVMFESIEYWSCSICGKNYKDPNGTEEALDIVEKGHSLLNQNVINYLSATTEEEVINALKSSTPFNDQVKKTVSWNASTGPYTIEVACNADFNDSKSYTSNTNSFTFPGSLIPGQKYYYRVKDASDNYVKTLDGFKVDDEFSVRTLHVDGVSNVRDAGGWTAKDGNPVLYNKIIRGGRLPNITASGKDVFFNELGIKTEIDLRTDGTKQLDDDRLDYHKLGMNQYTMLVPNYTSPLVEGKNNVRYGFDTTTPATLKSIFELLANPGVYPVYYHCNAGADRTGSLTYLINGLLGVSYEDLTKDFELTTFSSQGNRFRSGVSGNSFVTEGEMAGIYECDSNNYVAWGKLHELISTNYAQENGELASAIEYYLKKVCDVNDETIAAVRRNLLGKDVEFDPVELKEDTTFTPTNGNWTINSQLQCITGTYFGKDAYKFETIAFTDDHYIENSLALITNEQYTTFHFEVYVPHESAKWNTNIGKDTGERFKLSIKPMSGSTSYINYSESETGHGHLELDTWQEFEVDISSYTELKRFAFYIPYGTSDIPAIIYLRNVYVS